MAPAEEPQAVLVVLHADILLPGQIDDLVVVGVNAGEAIPPTRPKPEHVLTEEECVIGRNPDCTICFKKHRTDISRRHAMIKYERSRFVLYDYSTHGTFVNQQQIDAQYPLHNNDIIGFANSLEMLRFIDRSLPAQVAVLTEREHDVLELMASGRSNKEIGSLLHIDIETVKTHATHIYSKLDVGGRIEAIARARILGLLKPRAPR